MQQDTEVDAWHVFHDGCAHAAGLYSAPGTKSDGAGSGFWGHITGLFLIFCFSAAPDADGAEEWRGCGGGTTGAVVVRDAAT
ncbi:hypothetical protein TPAR_07881 [Tolypocladium paradoxum]|uniref:Uncharacterized protein n=1 Tax=Tolypocladium paradoxum TaxID=94208 RepID=A0A2S4KNY8_9HYPO|nr:hypothetical protein TPAR_07881 [Tolypocladium paradoxum]